MKADAINTERLLAHYARIADAPDAVARLRRFILDLAVRGKLVPQDPDDEPARELLKRIAAEKRRFGIKEMPAVRSDRTDLPNGWAVTTLGNYAVDVFTGPFGSMLHQADYVHGGVPVINPSHMKDDRIIHDPKVSVSSSTADRLCSYALAMGDIVMARRGEVGRAALVESNQSGWLCGTGSFFLRFVEDVNRCFLLLVLKASSLRSYLAGKAVGTTMVNLNHGILNRAPMQIPPLAEQHRIVAKVDELMALCDRLEAARAQRESTRDRLAAASLARLNAPDPDPATFADHARFALGALPALTTRPDQIKQLLRQTILNLAVRGKLAPQDPADEPAEELLRRTPVLPRPARYAKRSPECIPGDCGLSINHPGREPPNGWLWVPLVEIARLESGHTPSRNRPDWWGGDVPWIGLVDARLNNNGTILETIQATNEQGLANSAARLLPAGTVCFSRTASVGYVVVMGRPMATSQDFVNWVPTDAISSRWLQLVMIAERPAIGRFSKGAVHQTIYYPAWLSMHIALPPLAEQHRIVAKVDELMALCDRLEASLTTADDTRRRLLDALLHEALTPATTNDTIETAEALATLGT